MGKWLPRYPRDSVREDRIAEKVHAKDATEVEGTKSWRRYVTQSVSFPFSATYTEHNTSKPLCSGARVQVIGLGGEEQCAEGLVAKVMDGQSSVLVPLELLSPSPEQGAAVEAVLDWHYWHHQERLKQWRARKPR